MHDLFIQIELKYQCALLVYPSHAIHSTLKDDLYSGGVVSKLDDNLSMRYV